MYCRRCGCDVTPEEQFSGQARQFGGYVWRRTVCPVCEGIVALRTDAVLRSAAHRERWRHRLPTAIVLGALWYWLRTGGPSLSYLVVAAAVAVAAASYATYSLRRGWRWISDQEWKYRGVLALQAVLAQVVGAILVPMLAEEPMRSTPLVAGAILFGALAVFNRLRVRSYDRLRRAIDQTLSGDLSTEFRGS